jgi:hypothetical protein
VNDVKLIGKLCFDQEMIKEVVDAGQGFGPQERAISDGLLFIWGMRKLLQKVGMERSYPNLNQFIHLLLGQFVVR